jgi:hypothetical protein
MVVSSYQHVPAVCHCMGCHRPLSATCVPELNFGLHYEVSAALRLESIFLT